MFCNDANFALLNKMLDVTTLQREVIANNIANVDTPGYKRKEVDFAAALEEALRSGDPQEAEAARLQIIESAGLPVRPDGNNVDIDTELSALVKNTLTYNTFVHFVSTRFLALKEAITGGR